MRLAVLSTHPIQYQAPLFRVLSQRPGVALTALFCDDHGVQPSFDPQFGRVIRYDVPLLDGYTHRFLRNIAPCPGLTSLGLVNPDVLRALVSQEFDAIVVHGYSYATSLLTLLGPRRRTRVLMRGESHLLPRRSLAKRVSKQLVLRPMFKRIDHFLPIGTLNWAYYSSYGVRSERMTLAPYSVDNSHFALGSAEARRNPSEARRRLGLPESVPLFLCSAKLIAKKRPFDALRAFADVRARAPCGLVYVGDGVLAEQLDVEIAKLGLQGDVYRLGFRNQSELPAIYGACDVLLMPSDYEPWGLVVNEAMACGMAVVVSDHVGAGPDLAEPEFIHRAGDYRQLSTMMARLATAPPELAEAKRRAGARILQWGLEETADGVLQGARAAIARA
jgi:glycosyltransferase involved in cell wall biosynthesis